MKFHGLTAVVSDFSGIPMERNPARKPFIHAFRGAVFWVRDKTGFFDMTARALVTGANGMLADALCPLLRKGGYEIFATDIIAGDGISPLDVTNQHRVGQLIGGYRPDIIFHLAAETDVDKCELEKQHAIKVNAEGTKNVAAMAELLDIPLVYISTGAVFDGSKMNGYTEEDTPNPLSIYGLSKLKGEAIVSSTLKRYYIVRAGWMIGGHKKDKKFVWKILQLLKTKAELSVVTDKFGSPTFTKDFAQGILGIVSHASYGIYHCVNKGICSRFDIARKILEYLNRNDVTLKPVTSEAFPLPAPRGKSEALVNYKLSNLGMDDIRTWQEALKEYIEEAKDIL